MPKVDGFEVLRQLRADPQFATMPVVMMTSSSEERDIAQGYRLGVNSFVHKPVEFASFQQAVEEVGLYWMLLNKAPQR
jgi:two-component system response regulator